MNRRKILTGAGMGAIATLSGCLGAARTLGEIDDAETNNKDSRTCSEFKRYVSITKIDGTPSKIPVEFDVHVVDGTVTSTGTALLEISITNTAQAAKRLQTPFYKGSANDGESTILLYSQTAPDGPSTDHVPPCIEDPEPSKEWIVWTDEGILMHDLDPDETGTDTLIVVNDPTREQCFPPGKYRFEQLYSDQDTKFLWGFTIEIADTLRSN